MRRFCGVRFVRVIVWYFFPRFYFWTILGWWTMHPFFDHEGCWWGIVACLLWSLESALLFKRAFKIGMVAGWPCVGASYYTLPVLPPWSANHALFPTRGYSLSLQAFRACSYRFVMLDVRISDRGLIYDGDCWTLLYVYIKFFCAGQRLDRCVI